MPTDGLDVALARAWARTGRKIALVYRDKNDERSARTVWPVAIAYFDAARILVGWCELRQAFRDFRVDRVVSADFLDERFPCRPAELRRRWSETLAAPVSQPTAH
jgi:predicted DNA-binding transcriptional regulator YafY